LAGRNCIIDQFYIVLKGANLLSLQISSILS
jgi:hypothetical protein